MQSDCDCQWSLGTRCGLSHLTHPISVCRNRFFSGLAARAANHRGEITLTLDRQCFPMLTRGLQAPVELTDGAQTELIDVFRLFQATSLSGKICSVEKVEWRKEYRPLAALRTKGKQPLGPCVGNSTWTGNGFTMLVVIALFSSTPCSEVPYLCGEKTTTTIKLPLKCSMECFAEQAPASDPNQNDKEESFNLEPKFRSESSTSYDLHTAV